MMIVPQHVSESAPIENQFLGIALQISTLGFLFLGQIRSKLFLHVLVPNDHFFTWSVFGWSTLRGSNRGQLGICSQGRWTVLPHFVCETQLRQVRDSGWKYADNPGAMEARWLVMDEWLHLEINCHGEVNLASIRKAGDSFVCKTTTQSSWWRW